MLKINNNKNTHTTLAVLPQALLAQISGGKADPYSLSSGEMMVGGGSNGGSVFATQGVPITDNLGLNFMVGGNSFSGINQGGIGFKYIW